MLKYLAAGAAAAMALWPVAASAAPAWEQWQQVKGIVDIDGPRSDGAMVVAGSASLFLLDTAGTLTPFATGPGGYHEVRTGQPYIAVSRGEAVSGAGCSFTRDETFILRLRVPIGLIRVSATGEDSGSFANLPGTTTLNGIAFDDTGAFGHRLLVTGPSGSRTAVFAVDCNGGVKVITRTVPRLEGGIAIAPSTFGVFAGDLIAPDELTGTIYFISPDGNVAGMARPGGLPVGGDKGVESVGFVPPNLISRGGFVYYSDRVNDSILRLSSSDLASAGVQEGDMLVATAGGASLIALRYGGGGAVIRVAEAPSRSSGEGHLSF